MKVSFLNLLTKLLLLIKFSAEKIINSSEQKGTKVNEQFEVVKNEVIYFKVKFKKYSEKIWSKTYSNNRMFVILLELDPQKVPKSIYDEIVCFTHLQSLPFVLINFIKFLMTLYIKRLFKWDFLRENFI